jgi:putative hydrolase of the HAD superfamily
MTFGVVFDLDDTLYLERDYVRSGFSAVASFAAMGDVDHAALFDNFLWDTFERGVRGRNFDLLIERFDLSQRLTVAELVSVYRHHDPTIRLLPDVDTLIKELRTRAIPLGLISDGPVVGQSAKLKALGTDQLFEVVILTDKWGAEYRKPHERGFITMEQNISAARPLVYIADNPAKDFVTPKHRGWATIRIRLDGQLHRDIEPAGPAAAPEFDLRGFDEVLPVLEGIGSEPLH